MVANSETESREKLILKENMKMAKPSMKTVPNIFSDEKEIMNTSRLSGNGEHKS
jgi:hypothetical protein